MHINIKPTLLQHALIIFSLYDDAIAYQKSVGNNHWLGFEPQLIAQEITEDRHFSIWADDVLVATFCITLSDPAIWADSNTTPAVYIHRIATSQAFRGKQVLTHIINWAKQYAKRNNLTYIRMDTGGGNHRLINYYVAKGFTFLGNTTVEYKPGMPAHYKDGIFALFQMPVEQRSH